MVLLFTDIFLLLTQVLLWVIVGFVTWYVLLKALPQKILSLLVLVLILGVIAFSFFNGPPADRGIIEALWRVISFPLSPFGLGVILLWAFINPKVKLTKTWNNGILITLGLLVLMSTPVVANLLTQQAEMSGIEQIQPMPGLTGGRRVIVVMGEGTTLPQVRSPQEARPTNPPRVDRPITEEAFQVLAQMPVELTDKGDRLVYAANLYRQEQRLGNAPLLVVTAGERVDRKRKGGERKEDVSEARDIQRFLSEQFGIPESEMLLDHDGGDLRQSAERVQRLLNDNRVGFGNQIVLVTSAISMGRSVLTFRQVFPEATVIARPTDFHALPSPDSLKRLVQGKDLVERNIQVGDILPSAEAFRLSSEVVEEFLKSIFYFLRGWVRPLR